MLNNEIKDKIRPFIEAQKDKDAIDRIQVSIKEDGVKALLVVPILYDYLGYNKIDNYRFEDPQSSAHSFADIILKDVFLIELKRFGILNDQQEKAKAEKQIKNYIQNQKDNINYGLLTDGITWELFIDKKYIEKHGNDEKDISEIDLSVPPCFTFKIEDENFLNILVIFHADCLEENIKRILCKAIANKTMNVPGRVALTSMFAKLENTQLAASCEQYLYGQITENFKIEKGEYYDHIINKSKKPDETIFFEDELIYIEGKITKNGKIIINPLKCKMKENQQEAAKKYSNLVTLLFSSWPSGEEACTYPDRKSIIKAILNQRKLFGEEIWLAKWSK